MGVFTRLLFGEEDEDDDEVESRLNYQNHNMSSVKRFGMLFVWGGITIYKAVKGLFWKFISIFFHAKPKPKPKPPYPFLPLHNPPPPSLYRIRPFSSPTCTFDDVDGGDLECGHGVDRENLARRQLLPLRNPASTSTNTEPLLLHPSALVSSPTTFDDDDDRYSSSTTFDDDRYSVCEDRILWCQAEIQMYQIMTDYRVADLDMATVFVDEDDDETPYLKKKKEEEEEEEEKKRKKKGDKEKEKKEVKETSTKAKRKKKKKLKEKVKEEETMKKEKKMSRRQQKKEEKRKEKEKEKEEEEKKKEKNVIVLVEERWIKHYSSRHRILLVGEGNFSFSACLAKAFRCAPNVTATSLDSEAFLKEHYGKALSNIEELRSRGSKVLHSIDATAMANHPLLRQLKFDRIVFNFPYAGLQTVKKLPRQTQLELHRRLVSQFIENAREMISIVGEIHITHKTNGFHAEWRVASIARERGLRLIEAVDFKLPDYPGYKTKCGFGGNNYFDCYPSKTYKFGLPSQN